MSTEDEIPKELPDKPQGTSDAPRNAFDDTQPGVSAYAEQADMLAPAPVSSDQTNTPVAVQTLERRDGRYRRWFQVLAVVLLLCVIGGIVLLVQPRQATQTSNDSNNSSNNGSAVRPTSTPLPPLNVTRWCVANSAPVDAQLDMVNLNKVVALSSNDAWVLGLTQKGENFADNSDQILPLLEHWNGRAWGVVQTADTSAVLQHLRSQAGGGQAAENVTLNDISVLSDNNIWAVGSILVIKNTPISDVATRQTFVGGPLIEHWDGTTWQIITGSTGYSSQDRFGQEQLMSISAISANDIWASGRQEGKINISDTSTPLYVTGAVPLTEHWDGTKWTEQKLPSSDQQQPTLLLNGTQALSSNDVWSFNAHSASQVLAYSNALAVQITPPPGIKISGLEGYTGTYPGAHILHWDGQSWSEVKLPDSLSKNTSLNDLAVISDSNIWALGETINTGDAGTNVIYHWDGKTWSRVTDPPGLDAQSSMNALSVIAPDNIWLLGGTDKHQPVMEHWNGKAWNEVSPTSPAQGEMTDMALAGSHAWALAYVNSSTVTTHNGVHEFVSADLYGKSVLETSC